MLLSTLIVLKSKEDMSLRTEETMDKYRQYSGEKI
jgi:hypothetical protein